MCGPTSGKIVQIKSTPNSIFRGSRLIYKIYHLRRCLVIIPRRDGITLRADRPSQGARVSNREGGVLCGLPPWLGWVSGFFECSDADLMLLILQRAARSDSNLI